jgi:energy-coupling factor transport system ATP-binding protein
MHSLISGPNFSGRSAALMALLRSRTMAPECFFIGPYAEAALSGLAATIADEISIYRSKHARPGRAFAPLDFAAMGERKPQTLSGGEQVLLALHCFSRSGYPALAIDTALEQLDHHNRAAALDYLDPRRDNAGRVALIDNRLPPPQLGWSCTELSARPTDFAGVLAQLATDVPPCAASRIVVRNLDFSYRNGNEVFRGVDLALEPGKAYRLAGANGAGKTTLLKLLVGVLAPSAGELSLGDARYRPWRSGNLAIALATQNPDHQWCGATLAEDLARRRRAFGRRTEWPQDRLESTAGKLGVHSLHQQLYELPLAARKRLSWLWPLSGLMPWVMLDEPTIGQDAATRHHLAAAASRMCALGYGVLFVTHDDDFAGRVAHRRLMIGGMTIRVGT